MADGGQGLKTFATLLPEGYPELNCGLTKDETKEVKHMGN